jgi:hypothetical protein
MNDNKLIAEFMDLKSTGLSIYKESDYKYHTSWDWLMPVVEKIDEVSDENTLFKIEYNRAFVEDIENYYIFIDVTASSRLEATYKAVVEFIKNNNLKTI